MGEGERDFVPQPRNVDSLKGRVIEAAIAYVTKRDDRSHARLISDTKELIDLPSRNLRISTHVLERCRARVGCKTLATARNHIEHMIDNSTEVFLKDEYRAVQLINHKFKDARYFKYNKKWMLVVVEDEIVTCYKDEAGRWR